MRAVDAIVCTSGLSMSTGAYWAGSYGRPDGYYGCHYRLVRGTQRTRSNECKAYHREDRDITRHQDQANCRRDDGRARRAMQPSPKKGKESLTKDTKKVHLRYQKGTPLAGKLSPYSICLHYVRLSRYALLFGELSFCLCLY